MSYWKSGHLLQEGKYIIEEVLSDGGFGVIYRAKEQSSGRLVAIKTLNAFLQSRPDFAKHQERFVKEAFSLAKCSHNHIIRVHDVCKESELWCMVMEYLPGGTLEEWVKAAGILSEEEALLYIYQIGQALTYIHQQGFLHRDVKPANIMLRENRCEAVLIDFGLARDFSEGKVQTHTNDRTESFAPIEQYQIHAKRGAYTDIYALAATLYYLLTAQLPFPANFRSSGVNLIPPQQHNPQIKDSINDAIIKGMALKPEDRPQSVQEWLDLLLPGNSSPPKPEPEAQPPLPSPLSLEPFYREPKLRTPLVPGLRARPIQSPVAPPSGAGKKPPVSSLREISPEEFLKANKLPSAVGEDYTQLRDLLVARRWLDADRETAKVMLQAAGRYKRGWLEVEDIEQFPCEDLFTINCLWKEISKGHFGFSVQKEIYQSLGGSQKYDAKIWATFGDRVGWRLHHQWLDYENFNFTPAAPKGHLPMLGFEVWGFKGWVAYLAARLTECNIV